MSGSPGLWPSLPPAPEPRNRIGLVASAIAMLGALAGAGVWGWDAYQRAEHGRKIRLVEEAFQRVRAAAEAGDVDTALSRLPAAEASLRNFEEHASSFDEHQTSYTPHKLALRKYQEAASHHQRFLGFSAEGDSPEARRWAAFYLERRDAALEEANNYVKGGTAERVRMGY